MQGKSRYRPALFAFLFTLSFYPRSVDRKSGQKVSSKVEPEVGRRLAVVEALAPQPFHSGIHAPHQHAAIMSRIGSSPEVRIRLRGWERIRTMPTGGLQTHNTNRIRQEDRAGRLLNGGERNAGRIVQRKDILRHH